MNYEEAVATRHEWCNNVRFVLWLYDRVSERDTDDEIWAHYRTVFFLNLGYPVSAWDVAMHIIKREGLDMTYHVDVSTRNGRGEPIRAAVRAGDGEVAIVCRQTTFGWEPLSGLRLADGSTVELPACFQLHPDAQMALELAL